MPSVPPPAPDWIGQFAGLNTKAPAYTIGAYECADMLNLLIDELTLKLRGGRETILDTLTATTWIPLGGTRVYGLGPISWDYIAGTFDGTRRIKSNRTGVWSDVLSGFTVGTENRVEFLGLNKAIYVFFGSSSEVPRKVTGNDVVGTVAWGPVIRPTMGVWHKKRLWVDDVGNKGRIWLSDSDNPDSMRSQTSATDPTHGGYIDLVVPDGDNIRGLASFGQFLIVFSERSIYFISGTTFANFVINGAFGFGTKSPRSIILCENDLWFLDSGGIVRFISGSQPNISATVVVGIPGYFIEPTTKAIDPENLPKVVAVYHDRRYWLFYAKPGGTRNERAACWQFRELPVQGSRWTLHKCLQAGAAWMTGGPGDKDLIYFLDANAPRLWKFPFGTTDGTDAISFKWKSRAYAIDAPQWEKGLAGIAPVTLGYTGNLTVNAYKDLQTTVTRTYALTYTGGTFERQETKRPHADVQGRLLQVEITGQSSTGLSVAGIELEPTMKRRA